MADQKVWHVLGQTIYLPPNQYKIAETGETKQSGSMCLGDILKGLDYLDFRINEEGPAPYPVNMPVEKATTSTFKWHQTEDGEFHLSAGANVPIAQAGGINVGAETEAAMKKSISRFFEVASLEAHYIQPRTPYVNRAMSDKYVVAWLDENKSLITKSWKFYMITGLLIARGKKSKKTDETRSSDISGGFNVSAPTVAEGHAKAGHSAELATTVEAGGMDDFVWAIRLAKISRRWPAKVWSIQTYFRDAVFEDEDEDEEEGLCTGAVKTMLEADGLRNFEVVGGQGEGSTPFIIRAKAKQPSLDQ